MHADQSPHKLKLVNYLHAYRCQTWRQKMMHIGHQVIRQWTQHLIFNNKKWEQFRYQVHQPLNNLKLVNRLHSCFLSPDLASKNDQTDKKRKQFECINNYNEKSSSSRRLK